MNRRIILFLFLPLAVFSQSLMRGDEIIRVPDPGIAQIITTKDGKRHIGKVSGIAGDSVVFAGIEGEDTIFTLENIAEIREVPEEHIRKGKYWFPNPNASRIVLARTGRPLAKGRGYIADFEILLPVAAYGLTDNFTVAAGATVLNKISTDGSFAAFYLLPKLGFDIKERLAIAVGGGWIQAFGVEEEFQSVGFAYGALTLGSPDASLTAGTGYGFSRNRYWVTGQGYQHDVLWPQVPGILLGGEWRVARQFSILSENYLIHDGESFQPIAGYGFRAFGERYTADVILYNVFGYSGLPSFPGIPFIGLAYNF